MLGLHIAKRTPSTDQSISTEGIGEWFIKKKETIKNFATAFIAVKVIHSLTTVAPKTMSALITIYTTGAAVIIAARSTIDGIVFILKDVLDLVMVMPRSRQADYFTMVAKLQDYAEEIMHLIGQRELTQRDVDRLINRILEDFDLRHVATLVDDQIALWKPSTDVVDRLHHFARSQATVEDHGYTAQILKDILNMFGELALRQNDLVLQVEKLRESDITDDVDMRKNVTHLITTLVGILKMTGMYLQWYRRHDLKEIIGQFEEDFK